MQDDIAYRLYSEYGKYISLHVLLYGDNSLSFQQNVEIFQIVLDFIVRTKRFSKDLLLQCKNTYIVSV